MSVPVLSHSTGTTQEGGEIPKQRWRVMISSAMRGFAEAREAVAQAIREEELEPWYAEHPPDEFRSESPADISYVMARRCDLYVLIITARYGSKMIAGDDRSVTHQEYDEARKANPRKVRVFIATEVLERTDSEELRKFIDEVASFEHGYVAANFSDTPTLVAQVREAIRTWRRDGSAGRDAYAQSVVYQFTAFRNPATGSSTPYDDTVLLKLKARRQEEKRPRDGMPREQQAGERRDDDKPAPVADLLAQHQRLVVLGDVGAGKSTLLRRLAHDTAQSYLRDGSLAVPSSDPPRLPILISASRLGREGVEHPETPLAEVVGALMQEETRFADLKPTIAATTRDAFYRGRALLLVDSLDEAMPEEQSSVFRLLEDIGGNWAVLASRPAAYRGELDEWRTCDVQALEPEQREELIARVFPDVVGHAPDATLPSAADLERDLNRRADLAAWAGNPLLLSLIAVQYARDRALPEHRARIYEFAIEDMQRQRPPTARRYLTQSELDRLLKLLALQMTEALTRSTTPAEVATRYLDADLRLLFPLEAARVTAASEVLERSGVLQQDGERYEFVHLSFREYLAASAVAALPSAARRDIIRRRCLHQQWEQVLLLLVSQFDATGRVADADQAIEDLAHADRQAVQLVGGPDPTHLALRLATTCWLARRATERQGRSRHILQLAWWRVWKAEVRWSATGGELRDIRNILRNILRRSPDGAPDPLAAAITPSMLHGTALVAPMIFRGIRWPASRWWTYALLAIAMLLAGTYLVGQAALHWPIAPDAGSRGLLDQWLPIVTCSLLVMGILMRLAGFQSRLRRNRTELWRRALRLTLEETLSVLEPPLVVDALPALLPLFQDRRSGRLSSISFLDSAALSADRNASNASSRRRSAFRALHALGPAAAHELLPALLPLLRSSEADVRLAAVMILSTMGNLVAREAAPVVRPLVHDLDAAVRVWSARVLMLALESAAVREVLPVLVPLVHDADDDVEQETLDVLKYLGRLGPDARAEALPILLPLLQDDDANVRRDAVRAVEWMGLAAARAVQPALVALLDDADSDVSEAVLQALETLAPAQLHEAARLALAAIVPQLGDVDADVRSAAVEKMTTLRKLGIEMVEEALPLLLPLLQDEDVDVRYDALRAIVALKPKSIWGYDRLREESPSVLAEALPPLLALLHDSDPAVRFFTVWAIEAMGVLGPTVADEVLPVLLPALQSADEEADVRIDAIRAIGQLGAAAVTVLPMLLRLAGDGEVGGAAVDAIKELSPLADPAQVREAVTLLMTLLASQDTEQRNGGIEALSTLAPFLGDTLVGEAVRAMVSQLQHPDAPLRSTALQALGTLMGQADPGLVERMLPAILPLLQDVDADVAAHAYEALERALVQSTPEIIIGILPKMLPLFDGQRGGSVESLLIRIGFTKGPEVTRLALPALMRRVRLESISNIVLEMLGPNLEPEVISELLTILLPRLSDDNARERALAVSGVSRLGERAMHEALPHLLPLLDDADDWVRRRAAEAVGSLGPDVASQVRPVLMPLLKENADEDVPARVELLPALNALGPAATAAFPALYPLLRDKDQKVRAAAVQAFERQSAQQPLPPGVLRQLARMAQPAEVKPLDRLMQIAQVLLDWPLLLAAIYVQVIVIWPIIGQIVPLPPSLRWLFALTGWWQVLAVAGLFLVAYVGLRSISLRLVSRTRFGDIEAGGLVESTLRRWVVDTQSERAADSND